MMFHVLFFLFVSAVPLLAEDVLIPHEPVSDVVSVVVEPQKEVAKEAEVTITKDDVKDAVKSLQMQKENMIREMSSLPEDARRELFNQFKMQMQQEQGDFGPDAIALKIWYPQYQNKSIFFDHEQERQQFEDVIESGEIIGIHEEKGFAVVKAGNSIFVIPASAESAMELIQKIATAFEGKTEKDMTPEFIFATFDTFATEMKSDFLHDMLFFSLFAKVTKSWIPDILAALKHPSKKR